MTALPDDDCPQFVTGTTAPTDGEDCSQLDQRNRGGSPIKDTIEAVLTLKEKQQITEATETAAKRFKQAKDNAKAHNSVCAKGTLVSIIQAVELEDELPAGTLKINTVISRVRRNNASGTSSLAPPAFGDRADPCTVL
jgi:type II secretory pathway component PulF